MVLIWKELCEERRNDQDKNDFKKERETQFWNSYDYMLVKIHFRDPYNLITIRIRIFISSGCNILTFPKL